jgi:hypothetical protein
MVILAASSALVGVAIGLHFDIRMIISATLVALVGMLGAALMGWASAGETVFAAFATTACLQAGYVAIVILDGFGMVEAKERAASVPLTPPSASDSPSHR